MNRLNELQTIEKRFTYRKNEKLKSRKLTDELFSSGKVITQFPLKFFYLIKPSEEFSVNIGVGAGKRYFKKAVHRNRVKRLLREAYRLNKHLLEPLNGKHITAFILFTDKELPAFETVNEKVKNLLSTMVKRIHERA